MGQHLLAGGGTEPHWSAGMRRAVCVLICSPLGVAGRNPTGNEHQWLRYACSVHKTCLFG